MRHAGPAHDEAYYRAWVVIETVAAYAGKPLDLILHPGNHDDPLFGQLRALAVTLCMRLTGIASSELCPLLGVNASGIRALNKRGEAVLSEPWAPWVVAAVKERLARRDSRQEAA